MRFVALDGRDRAATLTDRGHRLLEAHRREREHGPDQAFYDGVSRPRELSHDAQLYRAYLREEDRLRHEGADIRRVVLEQELKRESPDVAAGTESRPTRYRWASDRDEREIERWANEHDLSYFDNHVHFPDFRIEYELDGRDHHEDVEVVTAHYRGAHAASVARS